jgi:hypothetical protein
MIMIITLINETLIVGILKIASLVVGSNASWNPISLRRSTPALNLVILALTNLFS